MCRAMGSRMFITQSTFSRSWLKHGVGHPTNLIEDEVDMHKSYELQNEAMISRNDKAQTTKGGEREREDGKLWSHSISLYLNVSVMGCSKSALEC
jgi:hypothetical protein